MRLKLPMQSRWLIATSTLAMIAAACGKPEGTEKTASNTPSVDVSTLVVKPIDTPNEFEVVGTVRARLNATLSSKVMSRVMAVSVHEGDPVRSGQSLIQLDSRELAAAVDVAASRVKSTQAGLGNAKVVAEMESQTSRARIAQAEAQVGQAKAAVAAAQSRLDLALAGPRTQERTQAHLAVEQAASSLKYAKTQLERTQRLVDAGAIAGKQLDMAQNAYDVAKAQYDSAVQSEKIAIEGSRAEDIRTAREGVSQAKAALRQAIAGLGQARASALQTNVRKQEVVSAKAQTEEANASLRSAQVTLAYGVLNAPFDGYVVKRYADPGMLATPGAPLVGVEGGDLRLEASVPESQLRYLSVGKKLPVSFDALPDGTTTGTISEIAREGDASSRSFLVKLTLGQPKSVRSGMYGRARIVTGNSQKLLIPSSATWEREGLHWVYVVDGQQIARLRIVTLGKTVGSQTEVLSGLTSGDHLVVGDRNALKDGGPVKETQK